MEDFLLLDIPIFQPKYKRWKTYGYTNRTEKENLKAVLEESTNGYCMYCFSRIRVDKKLYANLEHAIEKGNSDKLVECIPNIGISCMVCNQIFKRMGEKKRRLSKSVIERYESKCRCSVYNRKQCTVSCSALRELQKNYSGLSGAEIILQPMGIRGEDSGKELSLQYHIINLEFQPAKNRYTYSNKEIAFIDAHIKRFRLNAPQFRSRQLFDFIKNIVDNNGKIPVYEYNNLVVELFKEKLSNKSQEEVLKICKSIFVIIFPKMQGI